MCMIMNVFPPRLLRKGLCGLCVGVLCESAQHVLSVCPLLAAAVAAAGVFVCVIPPSGALYVQQASLCRGLQFETVCASAQLSWVVRTYVTYVRPTGCPSV